MSGVIHVFIEFGLHGLLFILPTHKQTNRRARNGVHVVQALFPQLVACFNEAHIVNSVHKHMYIKAEVDELVQDVTV